MGDELIRTILYNMNKFGRVEGGNAVYARNLEYFQHQRQHSNTAPRSPQHTLGRWHSEVYVIGVVQSSSWPMIFSQYSANHWRRQADEDLEFRKNK